MFFPSAFDRDLAVTCTQLVNAAYDMETQWKKAGKPRPGRFHWRPPRDGFTYGEPFWGTSRILHFIKEHEPFGFVARRARQIFVILRGTATLADDAEDMEVAQCSYEVPGLGSFGRVHEGFFDLYQTLRDGLFKALGEPPEEPGQLLVAGHSLGSSLTTLAFPDLLHNGGFELPGWEITQYNLASPRTGDVAFAKAYNAIPAAHHWQNAATYRVVNTADLVPAAPPPILPDELYQHVGIPVDFTAQYGSVLANHSCEHTYLYALEHPEDPVHPERHES